MSYIYAQGGSLGDTGGGVVAASQFSDLGIQYTGNRPCFVWFRGDLYVIGYYTRPVVRQIGAGGRFHPAGIRAPKRYLSVVKGSGTGGSEGACLAAITFLHKSGLIVLAESNFSNVVDVGTLAGEGRLWQNIDDTTAEPRVTHVRGYVSMDGAEFRSAWEAPYGVTAYYDNMRTAQLTYKGTEDMSKSIPPGTMFGQTWAGRMWYARSSNHPYRIWFSEPGYPQYVAPASFRDTWDKEPITGIARGRNELLVFCERGNYLMRNAGQTGADFVLEKLDSDVGCINHFGILEIHNKLWFPAEDGIWIYDGSFRYLMKEMQPLWRTDWETNKNAFRNGFALHDRVNKVYMWVTNRRSKPEFENSGLYPGTVVYAGYYGAFEPSLAGDQPHPEWTLDFKDRFDSAGFYDADGELVIGSCDGIVRKQDWTDGDDDGDLLRKTAIIRTGHQLYNEPGDDWESGKKLHQLWAYVESENTAWTIYVRGGDEQAWRSALPDNLHQGWKADVPASAKTETRLVRLWNGEEHTLTMEYVPETGWFGLPQQCTGQGFTFELRVVAPVNFQYRGIGGMWGPGPGSTRQIVDWTRAVIGVQGTWEAGACADLGISRYEYPYIQEYPHDWEGLQERLQSVATIAFPVGTPTYPITVTFTVTHTGLVGEGWGQENYTETVTINSDFCAEGGAEPIPCTCPPVCPDPPGCTPKWMVSLPWKGTVRASMVDANGIVAESEVGVVEITVAPA